MVVTPIQFASTKVVKAIYFSVPQKHFILFAHLKIRLLFPRGMVFKFCCQLSSFNLYPPGQKFFTEVVTITTELAYKVNAPFMVHDTNVKENVPVSSFDHTKYFLIYKIDYLLEQYISIVTKKSECLVVKSTQRNHSIFTFLDWPGILSEKLASRNGTFKSSTFQCFVKVLKIDDRLESFSFHSHNLTIHIREHMRRDAIFVVPNKECNFSYPCVTSIHTSKYSTLNVSVRNMSYNGYPSLDCQYGGLSLLYKQSEKLFELLTVCDKSHFISRNVYFQSENILLVLFWYTKYSSISVSIAVQKTHCKPVYLQKCNWEFVQGTCVRHPSGSRQPPKNFVFRSCKILRTLLWWNFPNQIQLVLVLIVTGHTMGTCFHLMKNVTICWTRTQKCVRAS